MIYLYLKTHNVTGLKYLGKTEQDPFIYKGSGERWKRHIKKHGYDVTTEILFATKDREKFKSVALYFSEKLNIVEDINFANWVPEQGDGGDTSSSPNFIKSLKSRPSKKEMSYEEIYGLEKATELRSMRAQNNRERDWSKRNHHLKGKSAIEAYGEERHKEIQSRRIKARKKTAAEKRNKIRKEFTESGLSRKEFSEKIGINYTTLKPYLKGL